MRAYRNMESRVTGVQKNKAHLYKGLSLLPREEFYAWARHSVDFWSLYRTWKRAGYSRRLTPSVNRLDSSDGYVLGNIEWITHSLNSALATRNRHAKAALLRVYQQHVA